MKEEITQRAGASYVPRDSSHSEPSTHDSADGLPLTMPPLEVIPAEVFAPVFAFDTLSRLARDAKDRTLCRRHTSRVVTGGGKTNAYWERNRRFKTRLSRCLIS